MEVSNLLVSEAHALGMDEGLASQLTKILEPLIEALREPHDLGLWLFNEEKCETVCQELEENLQGDGTVLLWKVASRLKEELKGIVSVHYYVIRRDLRVDSPVRAGSKELQCVPRFGGGTDRPVAKGALLKPQQALKRKGKVCKKKKLRASKKELLHFQRIGKNRRVFFAKGPNAPRCVILRGNRQYVCSQCRKNANENCRSFPSDDSSLLPGTNIDLADFKFLTQGVKSSKCSELKKQPNYFKIDLRRKANGYDRIVAYYDKKKKVPITMNFFSSKVMRKVYRFFPKYYIRVENQWFSTVLRVRTTQGKEKSYVFETLVHVAKEGKKLRLFTDALRDPHLKGVSADSLFITD